MSDRLHRYHGPAADSGTSLCLLLEQLLQLCELLTQLVDEEPDERSWQQLLLHSGAVAASAIQRIDNGADAIDTGFVFG